MKALVRFLPLLALLAFFSLPHLSAAEFKVVSSIQKQTLSGFNPTALVQTRDGVLYGTTKEGGTARKGLIFKITPEGIVSPVASLGNGLGDQRVDFFEGSDGNLYGHSRSTILKLTRNEVLTVLADATTTGLTNFDPTSLVEASDGNFYGTTETGGDQFRGVFFKLTREGVYTQLASFPPEIPYPSSLVEGSDGYFYGTTDAVIFKIARTGNLRALYQFPADRKSGFLPNQLVPGDDGNFYGTTQLAGAPVEYGTYFRMTPQGAVTILANFTPATGIYPVGPLIKTPDGSFYGQSSLDVAAKSSTVFRATPAGQLTRFANADGVTGAAANLLGTDGNLYGISKESIISRTTLQGATTWIAKFRESAVNSSPHAPLIQADNGTFFGATNGDGLLKNGTFFQLNPAGQLSTLVSLNGSAGANPQQGLVEGNDGNYYGTTVLGGGTDDKGAFFRLTPSGQTTRLATFPATDRFPNGVVLGSDGNFYGTTYEGGANNIGTVFKVTSSGELTRLASFDYPYGGYPMGRLIEGPDGNFYGTTSSHGRLGWGSIFRVTPTGVLTAVVTFNATGGANPQAGLLLGEDGFFYGTTAFGGQNNKGTVFKMRIDGRLTTLVSFNGENGDGPESSLIQAANGYFYGTTYAGGKSDGGTVFQLSPEGVLSTIVSLSRSTGTGPDAELLEALDGKLYGTTSLGGQDNVGTVFAIEPDKVQTISFPNAAPVYGQSLVLSGVSNSGLPVTYRVVSGPAEIVGRKVTFTGVGRVVLAATQRGNVSHLPAEARQGYFVRKAAQTLKPFQDIPTKTYPSAPFTIKLPVSSSGLPVTVTVNYGPATIVGNKVTLTGTGPVRLIATQPGDANHTYAKTIGVRFVVKAP